MTDITSVLEIDVKDDAFKALKADMDAFMKSVKEMGAIMPGKGGAQSVAQAKTRELVKDIEAQDKAMKKATESIFKFTGQFTKLTTSLAVDSGKKLVGAFTSLTKSIIGAGGLLTGIASVASIAGVVGAAGMAQRRMYQAAGLGFTGTQDISRLRTTLGQVFDVESVASHLQQELMQPSSLLISQMGMSQEQARMMDREKLMFRFARYAAEVGQRPGGTSQYGMEAAGLGFFGAENMARNLAMSGRLGGLESETSAMKGQTQLKSPEAWRSFWQFLAGGELKGQTMMMNIVEPLLDPIMKIGKTLGEKMEGGEGIAGVVDKIRIKMLEFNRAIGDVHTWHDFWELMKTSMKSAFDEIKALVKPIFDDIGKWFKDAMAEALRPIVETANMMSSMLSQFSHGRIASLLGISPVEASERPTPTGPGFGGGTGFEGAASRYGVNASILRGIAQVESGFDPNIISGRKRSPKGAIGLMQFMPGTAQQYGIDPTDPEQSKMGAGHFMADMLSMFGGDYDAALAGYNWGPHKVQRMRKMYGGDWKAHIPSSVRKYIQNVRANAGDGGIPVATSATVPASPNMLVTFRNAGSNSDPIINIQRAVGASK